MPLAYPGGSAGGSNVRIGIPRGETPIASPTRPSIGSNVRRMGRRYASRNARR